MAKRKGNKEGSIVRRSDGRYMGRYTLDGKRCAVYGATFEEVRVRLTEILSKIDKGARIGYSNMKFSKWLREWLLIYALPTVKQSTYKEAGVSDINFHALRHTFATRALEAGMDIKVLSSILGHAQASTTLNFYAHALPNHKKESMEKMSMYYEGREFSV